MFKAPNTKMTGRLSGLPLKELTKTIPKSLIGDAKAKKKRKKSSFSKSTLHVFNCANSSL
jgi:hypothetical protein